jgi:hypothetical protein
MSIVMKIYQFCNRKYKKVYGKNWLIPLERGDKKK